MDDTGQRKYFSTSSSTWNGSELVSGRVHEVASVRKKVVCNCDDLGVLWGQQGASMGPGWVKEGREM